MLLAGHSRFEEMEQVNHHVDHLLGTMQLRD